MKDADDQVTYKAEPDLVRLKNEWVDIVRETIDQIDADQQKLDCTFDPDSLVETFISSLFTRNQGKSSEEKCRSPPG